MSCCFPCFSRMKTQKETPASRGIHATPSNENKNENEVEKGKGNIAAQVFTFRELATATKNFRQECLVGEGGFGRVYKANLKNTGQNVAVKQLDKNGLQGNKEFLVEVMMLSHLHHENLVNLIGYCADGDQRLLIYEYMSAGSLEEHLFDTDINESEEKKRKPLDWFTRMKIASGAAKGLEYLHDKANPPVIYRDFKSANILLDDDLNPRLSDFGLVGDKIHVSSRVMGTYGYCAPEYARSGELTLKSDVYSFGVVLLELITGRRVIDNTRSNEEQNLVTWAQPIFKNPKRFPDMADPKLNKQFTESSLNQAVAIAAMCLQEEATVRPLISDVVTALSFLSIAPDLGIPLSNPVSQENVKENVEENSKIDNHENSDSEYDDDESSEDGGVSSSNKSSIKSQNGSRNSSQSVSSRSQNSVKFQEGSISYSRNESKDLQESVSLRASNCSESQDENNVSCRASNSNESQDEKDVSLSASNGGESYDESEEDENDSSIRQLSHKSGTKSQNKISSLSHKLSDKLSHKSSRGSQNKSFSSRSSSNRSNEGKVSSSE